MAAVLAVLRLVTVRAFEPAVVLACSNRALLLNAGDFGAAVKPLATESLGVLLLLVAAVLEMRGFPVLWVWLPTGSVLLLGCSSDVVFVSAGEVLLVTPLISVRPSDEEPGVVGNPFTGSFDERHVAGLLTDPDASC